MNILLQLYLCAPDKGGEFALSWGWLSELCRRQGPDDRIYVVSETLKQEWLDEYSMTNVRFLPVPDVDRRWGLLSYDIWQRRAYAVARNSGIHFDVVQLISMSDFRRPGLWYRFKDAYSVFGPVGGGQSTPLSLLRYDDLKTVLLREAVNHFNVINPFWGRAIREYSRKYGINAETVCYMPGSEQLLDVTLHPDMRELEIPERNNQKMIILFCGRLIRKKGVYLLLDIAAQLPQEMPMEVHVYGDGQERVKMEKRIQKMGLKDKVIMKGKVSYKEMRGGGYIEMQTSSFSPLFENPAEVCW